MDYIKLLELTIRNENPVYNYENQFRKYLNRLDQIKDLEFLEFLWATRKKGITIKRLINLNQIYFKFLLGYKKIKEITAEDFEIIYTIVFNSDLSNSSKISYLRGIKQILKYFKLNKIIDFEDFIIKQEKKPILNEELLTEDEKHFIISKIQGLQHRVFFTILFDSGLRVGEVFSVDKKSFQKTNKGYFVTINASKTTLRTIFIYSHNDLVKKLLNSNWEAWTFGYRTTYNIIKRFEKQLNKRLYHHLARHTKATQLSKKLTEQELKNYMGWTPNSKMLDNYIHLKNNDTVNKVQSLM